MPPVELKFSIDVFGRLSQYGCVDFKQMSDMVMPEPCVHRFMRNATREERHVTTTDLPITGQDITLVLYRKHNRILVYDTITHNKD